MCTYANVYTHNLNETKMNIVYDNFFFCLETALGQQEKSTSQTMQFFEAIFMTCVFKFITHVFKFMTHAFRLMRCI